MKIHQNTDDDDDDDYDDDEDDDDDDDADDNDDDDGNEDGLNLDEYGKESFYNQVETQLTILFIFQKPKQNCRKKIRCWNNVNIIDTVPVGAC